MSELDVLKEKIAYLKVLFGILVVTEISLVGWLASNFTEATILMRMASITAIVGMLIIIFAFHRRIEMLIERLRDLQHGYHCHPCFPGIYRHAGLLRHRRTTLDEVATFSMGIVAVFPFLQQQKHLR